MSVFKLIGFGCLLALLLSALLLTDTYSIHPDNIAKKGILNTEYLFLDKYELIGTEKKFLLGECLMSRGNTEEDKIFVLKCSVLDTLFSKCNK